MVMTVNSIGAVFQLFYIILFITYAEKGKKVVTRLSMIRVWQFVLMMEFVEDFVN